VTTPASRRQRARGPGPWIVLVCVALVPALVLWLLADWSAGQADDGNEAAPDTTFAEVPDAAPVLTTALVGMRRVPSLVARDLNVEAFAGQVESFAGSLNDRSCVAVSVDGQAVATRNADVGLIPASTQKLPVAATALAQLGADHRFTTTVVAASDPVDGTIDGDMYLVGGGDPLLSSDWYPTSNLERYAVTTPTSLDRLADDVAAAGVTVVTGDLVGDGSRYDDEFYAPGWGNGVAGLEAGPYDALMVNDARVLGDDLKSNDPNEAAAREFARLLGERGVTIQGSAVSGAAPAETSPIASIASAPMSDVVAEMLGNSDNNTAELLVKELGVADSGTGSRDAGLDAVRAQLDEWGVDTAPIVLADGSGLSPDNRLTCSALLTVLQREASDSPVGQGLPVAAETGTLAEVFTDHAVAGRLTGKTGTLNNPPFNADPPAVKSLAGYLPVEGGGAVEYALILNGPTISDQSEYRAIWNDMADALATYPAGPSPAALGPR
jgi:D-alanyl-D-alanine carboxypeptidase/D-alanyl-D-alanine-endopeptidase (penicillin-binding protein 4)